MKNGWRVIALTAVIAALAAAGITALLVNIFERKQEARTPFYRVVEITDDTEDPAVWGKNFPLEYDGYKRTVDQVRTRYGGSEAVPREPTNADPRSIVAQSRLEEDPRLKTIMASAREFTTNATLTRSGPAHQPRLRAPRRGPAPGQPQAVGPGPGRDQLPSDRGERRRAAGRRVRRA